jgi:hypothetical protein
VKTIRNFIDAFIFVNTDILEVKTVINNDQTNVLSNVRSKVFQIIKANIRAESCADVLLRIESSGLEVCIYLKYN